MDRLLVTYQQDSPPCQNCQTPLIFICRPLLTYERQKTGSQPHLSSRAYVSRHSGISYVLLSQPSHFDLALATVHPPALQTEAVSTRHALISFVKIRRSLLLLSNSPWLVFYSGKVTTQVKQSLLQVQAMNSATACVQIPYLPVNV